MERKDAYLIVILLIISTLLGYAIIAKKPPTAYVKKPGQKPGITSFFRPKVSSPALSVQDVLKGIMVLNSEKDKGLALSDDQKNKVKTIFDNIKKKQEEYSALENELDKFQGDLEQVLTTKQSKFLKENRFNLIMMLQGSEQGQSTGKDLMEKLEKDLNAKK